MQERDGSLGEAGGQVRISPDENNQPNRITDGLGNASTLSFDTNQNLTSTTNASGRKTKLDYDYLGNPITATDPLGNTTHFSYDYNFSALKTLTDAKSAANTQAAPYAATSPVTLYENKTQCASRLV